MATEGELQARQEAIRAEREKSNNDCATAVFEKIDQGESFSKQQVIDFVVTWNKQNRDKGTPADAQGVIKILIELGIDFTGNKVKTTETASSAESIAGIVAEIVTQIINRCRGITGVADKTKIERVLPVINQTIEAQGLKPETIIEKVIEGLRKKASGLADALEDVVTA